MEGLFLEYQDPLFSIILFVSFIFVFALFTYLWSLYATKEQTKHLQNFTKRFDTVHKPLNIQTLLRDKQTPLESLELLAASYFDHASYEEVVEICIELLKRHTDALKRRDSLMLLAKAYFKAGFYKRAQTALVELLRYHTREPVALRHLSVIYERLRQYDEALSLLDSLEEMDQDVQKERNYFKMLKIMHHPRYTQEEKNRKLLKIDYAPLKRAIFSYLFRYDSTFALKHIDESIALLLFDILFMMDAHTLDESIVQSSKTLQAIFHANSTYECVDVKVLGIFAIDMLNELPKHVRKRTTLKFSYTCGHCHASTPLNTQRCANCLTLLDMHTSATISAKAHSETYYSF